MKPTLNAKYAHPKWTRLGCRKDKMPSSEVTQTGVGIIEECSLDDRMFVRKQSTRKLLAKYAGLCSGRYKKNIEQLQDLEYRKLCQALSTNPSLKSVIEEAGNMCPLLIQKIVGKSTRNSPTCGILQVAGSDFEDV